MTHKQRMLAAIAGQPTDRIPYAPRLDLWFRAHQRAGTLPAKYRNATLREMTDDLGFGYHAVIAPFRDLRSAEDDADRALGIYNLWMMPCRVVLENVKRTITQDGDRTIVHYDTPVGSLRTVTVYDESMRKAGVSITHVAEHPFKSPADYEPLGYLFENARVEPNYAGYAQWAGGIGDSGVAVAYVRSAASPMHTVQRDLMPMDTFFYEMADHPAELARLADRIAVHWDRLLAVAADAPADVFLLGANYDSAVQYPPFFRDHIGPWLNKFARLLHARLPGKFLLTHTDGENTGLLEHYLAAGFDVADSICPAPMTKLTFGQVREAFAGRITIMGGVPSVALLADSMSDARFERFMDAFFEQIGRPEDRGEHLILGISDTTPPAADFERIMRIAQRVEQFGPVGGAVS